MKRVPWQFDGMTVLVLAAFILTLPEGLWAAAQAHTATAVSPAALRVSSAAKERNLHGKNLLFVPAWWSDDNSIIFERTWQRSPAVTSTLVVRELEDGRRTSPSTPSTIDTVVDEDDFAVVAGIRLAF